MARTKQTAKKATGGLKPRKDPPKNKQNNNNAKNNNTIDLPVAQKAPRSAGQLKLPVVKRAMTLEQRAFRLFHKRRLNTKYEDIKNNNNNNNEIINDPEIKNNEKQWNRDFSRMANMLGVKYKKPFRVLWIDNNRTLNVSVLGSFDIMRRASVEKFIKSRFNFVKKMMGDPDIAKRYQIRWFSTPEMDKLFKQHNLAPEDVDEKAKYKAFRRKSVANK